MSDITIETIHTISSIKSFKPFNIRTQPNGNIVVIGLNEDICGISFKLLKITLNYFYVMKCSLKCRMNIPAKGAILKNMHLRVVGIVRIDFSAGM